ncbi:MAG TPA: S8 family serine peptidase, partial [Puia sp.]|nr:S8 family serine peptidase [Puia sp.]
MPKAILFFALAAFFGPSIYAQQRPSHQQPGFVHLKNGVIPIRRNIADASLRKDSLRAVHFRRHYYVLAQFDSLPDSSRRVAMAAEGLHLYDYVSDRTYLAELQDSLDLPTLKRYELGGIFTLPGRSKLSSTLQNEPAEEIHRTDKLIAIGYFGTTPESEIRQGLTAAGAVLQAVKFQPPRVLFARVGDTASLRRLAALPYVSYLASQPIQPKPLNYNNRAAQGADALGASSGLRLYGDGVVVGIGDDADPSSHVDFTGRLLVRTPAPLNQHGTHTTGSVAGGGILNPMYQGMAPHATVVSQYFSDILANASVYVSEYDMLLTNNSYTDYDNGCINDGQYDALAYATDAQLDSYAGLNHIFAAGNDGYLTCTPYPYEYATVKSGFQSAKNTISVGNIDNTNASGSNVYGIGRSSSAGPTADGRIKPELVAGGMNVISTLPSNTYGSSAGTSMAAPDVTGTLALLAQRYRQLYGGDPYGVVLKTLACISATDLGNPGPDYLYGYGALNGLAADKVLEGGQFAFTPINNGQTRNLTLGGIPAGAAQLKVMICWNDYPAAPYSATTLVNNLDLTVKTPTGVVHYPLILDPTPANVANNAVEGVDNVNNIEEVVINNPPAGSYTISIAGTSVPYGPQYVALAYMLVQPGITMQYPYGSETWVPGNPEVIRWNATDGGTNPFTIAYSADNGATWTTINNSVPGNSQMYNWTTPATATNQALIRVSRNGTAYSGTCTYPFVVLGQPVVTGTSPCQGYAQLSWSAIPSATSYDIMQLVGDTMVKVASTTGTSYLVGNLNRDSSYWLGVRAVNGTTPGRRSISVNIDPTSTGGACNLSALDNDYTVDSAIGLNSGRLYTSTQLPASTPIQVEVRNLGTVTTSSSYTMNYSINGGTPVTETSTATVPPNGGAFNYTFSTPANFSAQGTYTIRIWVNYPGDPAPGNDTLTAVVKQLSNAPLTLSPPYTEGLESAAAGTYASPTMGFAGLDRCDFNASSPSGRSRTYLDQGMCRTGNRCAILDQAPAATVTTADSLIMTFNLSNYGASDQLWLDFYYRNQGIDSAFAGNAVWIRGNDQAGWIKVQTLDTNFANIGIYQPSQHIDITGTLASAVPAQTVSSSFQIKFSEQGYTSTNDVYTDGTVDNGYIFDDITLTRALNDMGVVRLVSPVPGNQCSLTSATPVSILVRNYTAATVTNIPVTYTVNGVTVNETIPSLAGDDSVVYTFATPVDMSAFQTYAITASVNYPGDTYTGNDTVGPDTLHTSPLISTFPYLEGFETGNGNWFTGGINSSWQWGSPTKTVINQAAGGNNCWVTSLTGDYNNNEHSYLYSPCFDLSSLTHPVLSFSHIFQTEDDCDCDYHWVEYSTDDTTWTTLGVVGNGTNWYDNATREAWQRSYTKWHVSSYDIPVTAPKVRFRIVMSSDPATTYEGVGIDDVHVFDKASVYTGADDSLTQPVSGTGWVNFDLGGGRVAAINPNGQNLGLTNVKVFFNHGDTVRHDQTQYFLGRNLVIQPSNEPSGNVSVRFYFLDNEADTLLSATGCATCTTIPDAYHSGVTQFS